MNTQNNEDDFKIQLYDNDEAIIDTNCVRYEENAPIDLENENNLELTRKDAGWGMIAADQNDNSILNHYFSSFPLRNKLIQMPQFGDVTCMTVFDKADDVLITGHESGVVVLWVISSSEFARRLTLGLRSQEHTKKITGVAFCKEHRKIVTTSEDKGTTHYNMIIWNYVFHTEAPTLFKAYHYEDKISCLYVTPKADYAVFASLDRKIFVWNFITDLAPKIFATSHTDLILSLGLLLPQALRDDEKCAKYVIMSVAWDKRIVKYAFYEQGTTLPDGRYFEEDRVIRTTFDTKSHMKSITCLLIHFPYDRGHKEDAVILSVSPIILTGSLDWSVIIWDYETGNKHKRLEGHKDQVNAIKVSDRNDDGSPPIVISASSDKTIILWDMVTGEKVRIVEHSSKLVSLAIFDSPEGIILFSADAKNALIWDLRKTKRTHILKTKKGVTVIETYKDRQTNQEKVLIGTVDNKWNMYDYCVHDHRPHDQMTTLGQAATTEEITTPSQVIVTHQKRINTGVIYSDGKNNYVISGDGNGKIAVWDLTNPKRLLKNTTADSFVVLSIALYEPNLFGRIRDDQHSRSPDPTIEGTKLDLSRPFVIAAGAEKKFRVYEFIVPTKNDKLDPTPNHEANCLFHCDSGHTANIRSLVIYHPVSDNEAPLLISGSYDRTAMLWDLRTFEKLRVFSNFHTDYVFFTAIYDPNIQFQANPRRASVDYRVPAVVTSSYDKKIGIWNMFPTVDYSNPINGPQVPFNPEAEKDLLLRRSFQAHTESVTALAIYTPNDEQLDPLIITGSIDRLIHIWKFFPNQDNITEKLHTLIGHTDRVCWIKIYDPPELQHPILFSGGDDDQTIVWKDAIYSKPFMPLQEVVRNAFLADCQTKDWPRISELAKTYSPFFFAENSNLFMMAVKCGRPDFLVKYWEDLVITLPTMKVATFLKNDITEPHPAAATNDQQTLFDSLCAFCNQIKDFLSLLCGTVCALYHLINANEFFARCYDGLCSLYNRINVNEFLEWCSAHLFSLHNRVKDRKYYKIIFNTIYDLYNRVREDKFFIMFLGGLHALYSRIDVHYFLTTLRNGFYFLYERVKDPAFHRTLYDPLLATYNFLQTLYNSVTGKTQNNKNNEDDDDDVDGDNDPLDDVRKELLDKIDFKLYSSLKENVPLANIPQEMIRRADILRLAISKCDLLAVRAIVLAWVKNLNQNMDSILIQRFYHSMFYLPMQTIQYLYYYYPAEFVFFICHLKLIENHASLMKGSQEKDLSNYNNKMEIKDSKGSITSYQDFWNVKEDCQKSLVKRAYEKVENSNTIGFYRIRYLLFTFLELWIITSLFTFMDYLQKIYSFISVKSIPPQPVTSLMIPFRTNKYLIHYLKWFVDVSNQLDNVDIFKSEIAIVLLNYFWQIYGRHAHVIALMKYLVIFGHFLLYAYYTNKMGAYHTFMLWSTMINVVCFLSYGYEEIKQIIKMQKVINWKTIFKHLCDLWNAIDVTIVITGILGSLSRIVYGGDIWQGRTLLAITSVCMWFKILYFLRPFPKTGPLVAMILQIAGEILLFLFVLFCLIAGFAQAFWLLSNNEPSAAFGTIPRAIKNSFLYTLGQDIDAKFEGIAAPVPAFILLVLFLILMMILMLNLLVALMGDVFAKVRSRGEALWRKEQASIIFEQEFLYEKLTIKKFIFTLKYSSDVIGKIDQVSYPELIKSYLASSDGKKQDSTDPKE